MEFWLLGPLEVSDGERLLQLGGSKRRALLALLILNANEVVSTDRLADELWGAAAPANAAGSIHNHISRLRKELGPDVLATNRWGYVLRADPDTIDLHRFERAIAEAAALPAVERAGRLAEALSLWRGPPLADLAFEPALSRHIAHLDERRFAALEQRIDADLELGRHAELVGELEALVAESPLREHFRWQLILALYRGGRQAEGLEVYRQTHRLLAEELGLEPSPELSELERAVLRHDPALALPTAPAERAGPDRTSRARLRARAAMVATVAFAALAAAGYALSTGVGKERAQTSAATASTSQPRPTATPAVGRPVTLPPAVTHQRSRVAAKHRPRRARARSAAPPATAGASPAAATTPPVPVPTVTRTTRTVTKPVVIPRPLPTTTTRPTTPTTTTLPPPSPQGPPTLADARRWWTGGDHSGAVVTRSGNAVTVTVDGTATDGFSAFVQTRCRVKGDFDAELRFRLLEWSGADGIWVSLSASDLGGVNAYRTDAFGESYGTYIPPTGGGAVPASGTSGILRLARTGSEISGYYEDGSGWVTIYSGAGPTTATALALGVFNIADVAPFAGRPATVSFDSFTLHAATLDC